MFPPLFFPSPWPYANLEKGYDLVTGQQAPERIFRWVLHFWCISWVRDSLLAICAYADTQCDDGDVPLRVCVHVCDGACRWASSRYTLTQLDGLTCIQPVLRWKCYPWALMWRNRPRGSLGWTPFKCFYCHFFLHFILDGVIVSHFFFFKDVWGSKEASSIARLCCWKAFIMPSYFLCRRVCLLVCLSTCG